MIAQFTLGSLSVRGGISLRMTTMLDEFRQSSFVPVQPPRSSGLMEYRV
jgi:hypothetical protein